MAKTISQDLLDFKASLSNELDKMKSKYSDIKDKINSIIVANETAISGINTYYNSNNKSTIINTLNNANKSYQKLNSESLEMLNTMISESETIIGNIKKLEDLKIEIEENEKIIDLENKKNEPSNSEIYSAKNKINTKTNEFILLNEETIKKINNLKNLDAEITIQQQQVANSSYLSLLPQLKFGKLQKKTYKASNGVKLTYMIYVPDYGEEVEGLPINMYMHGSGTGQNDVSRLTRSGLGRFIADKNLKPSGIVLLPFATTGSDYGSKAFRDALAELPLKVADEYKADKNKISLSGHSYGAITISSYGLCIVLLPKRETIVVKYYALTVR